jgi:hypothetical protein
MSMPASMDNRTEGPRVMWAWHGRKKTGDWRLAFCY